MTIHDDAVRKMIEMPSIMTLPDSRVSVIPYDLLMRKLTAALDEWAYDDAEHFVHYVQGLVDMCDWRDPEC